MSDYKIPIDEDQAAPGLEGQGDDDGRDLDMTPMIDCVFLLLIFFIVTASFQMQRSLEIPPPGHDFVERDPVTPEPDIPEDTIIVRIDEDNAVWVNGSLAPSEQDLLLKLREAKVNAPSPNGRPASTLRVLVNGEAQHDVVVMVLDAGSHIKMEHVQLALATNDY